jgi:RNA polymerase sigma-70 factor (ECF subfamily)
MRRISQDDERALASLIERYEHAVYGTALKMIGDATEAEDIAQQVFVRMYRAAKNYQPTASFKTWLFTILRNLVFNESRRRNRHTHQSLTHYNPEEETETPLPIADTSVKDPGQKMLEAELMHVVDEAILALPEQQRLAIVLRRYDELSYEEIAAILNLSLPATKSVIFRARETLREALSKYLETK